MKFNTAYFLEHLTNLLDFMLSKSISSEKHFGWGKIKAPN